jgi:hypothetical protein
MKSCAVGHLDLQTATKVGDHTQRLRQSLSSETCLSREFACLQLDLAVRSPLPGFSSHISAAQYASDDKWSFQMSNIHDNCSCPADSDNGIIKFPSTPVNSCLLMVLSFVSRESLFSTARCREKRSQRIHPPLPSFPLADDNGASPFGGFLISLFGQGKLGLSTCSNVHASRKWSHGARLSLLNHLFQSTALCRLCLPFACTIVVNALENPLPGHHRAANLLNVQPAGREGQFPSA